ncbi:MAG: hypothetical protein WCP21_16255 [Armatimonadota bacterium]
MTTTSKVWLATGAMFTAAALTLTPMVAQAAPADDTDSSAVGDSAGTPTPKRAQRGATQRDQIANGEAPTPRAGGASGKANATGSNPLLQNSLWWFGTPNPDPPPPLTTTTFEPLSNLPGFSLPFYGWYRNLNFEACVLGVGSVIGDTTTVVGPYGTSTSSISSGGC